MLQTWGIDASTHIPTKVTHDLCTDAGAIFVAGPSYLHRLLYECGEDFAHKSYLLADPFSTPVAFSNGAYKVRDPSFDDRPADELVREFEWLRERVLEIHDALRGRGRRLIPAYEYLELCKTVDRSSH